MNTSHRRVYTLHNVLSLLADLRGASDPALVWNRCNAPPDLQLWYLASVATAVRRRLGAHPLAHELQAAVAELRNRVEARTHHLHDVKGRDLEG